MQRNWWWLLMRFGELIEEEKAASVYRVPPRHPGKPWRAPLTRKHILSPSQRRGGMHEIAESLDGPLLHPATHDMRVALERAAAATEFRRRAQSAIVDFARAAGIAPMPSPADESSTPGAPHVLMPAARDHKNVGLERPTFTSHARFLRRWYAEKRRSFRAEARASGTAR
jgi:hypothetical protein